LTPPEPNPTFRTMTRFPDWSEIYRERPIERMPWFFEELDPDVGAALDDLGLKSGKALDLGTGPGTQAIALSKRGFDVTGSDLSEAAVADASRRAEAAGASVRFVADDILASKLGDTFDVVLDRGCFHVMAPDVRASVVASIAKLVRSGGHLLLKTFSAAQPGDFGPYRFTPGEIEDCFRTSFDVVSIKETIYQGQLVPPPFALFSVLRRK
jgi:2-polyprenyl-3-methyl-5-hydroxy-6-metoxy-1,4-benzoquinol methylase